MVVSMGQVGESPNLQARGEPWQPTSLWGESQMSIAGLIIFGPCFWLTQSEGGILDGCHKVGSLLHSGLENIIA